VKISIDVNKFETRPSPSPQILELFRLAPYATFERSFRIPSGYSPMSKAMVDPAIIERLLAINASFIGIPHYSKKVKKGQLRDIYLVAQECAPLRSILQSIRTDELRRWARVRYWKTSTMRSTTPKHSQLRSLPYGKQIQTGRLMKNWRCSSRNRETWD
jgi:hypothetical protein